MCLVNHTILLCIKETIHHVERWQLLWGSHATDIQDTLEILWSFFSRNELAIVVPHCLPPTEAPRGLECCRKCFLNSNAHNIYFNFPVILKSEEIQISTNVSQSKFSTKYVGIDSWFLSGLILSLRPANERCLYKVTPSLIGWVQI